MEAFSFVKNLSFKILDAPVGRSIIRLISGGYEKKKKMTPGFIPNFAVKFYGKSFTSQ